MDRFCECEIIGAVARDMKSTCMQCGGIDAYKKSKQRLVKINNNLEHVGWQQRYIDKNEGPSMWQFCDDRTADILRGRADYELRPVYA